MGNSDHGTTYVYSIESRLIMRVTQRHLALTVVYVQAAPPSKADLPGRGAPPKKAAPPPKAVVEEEDEDE